MIHNKSHSNNVKLLWVANCANACVSSVYTIAYQNIKNDSHVFISFFNNEVIRRKTAPPMRSDFN